MTRTVATAFTVPRTPQQEKADLHTYFLVEFNKLLSAALLSNQEITLTVTTEEHIPALPA